MKVSPRDAARLFDKPDQSRPGILIYGADAMRVALKRQQYLTALLGPKADEEMRLTRIGGADLRKDPALLLDGVKAVSFFPGPRAVFVDDAADTSATAFATALADWREGDAQIVATAGSLRASSPLRKLFEKDQGALCLAIYDDPPGRDEIAADLRRAGLGEPDRDGWAAITALARNHDPGEFRQTIEKLALYKMGDETPVTAAEVELCAPATSEAGIDELINATADGDHVAIGTLSRRLAGQGVQPVGLAIAATRHFRSLYAICCDPAGPASGIAKLRPPVFGPRRDRMVRQARQWGVARLEQALSVLLETDMALRSSQKAPQMAVMERCLIRLAMLGAR